MDDLAKGTAGIASSSARAVGVNAHEGYPAAVGAKTRGWCGWPVMLRLYIKEAGNERIWYRLSRVFQATQEEFDQVAKVGILELYCS